jgi:hypothetical protein
MCPWYLLLGIIIGTKKNAEILIKNNEYLFIIPGGSESFYQTYWYSKSKKYKTGFAKLAYNNNLAVIPIHGRNIANKLQLTKLYHILMMNINNIFIYKILFYIKMVFTLIFGSILVIPIPINIELIIGNHIYKKENETLIEFTKRCEYELNRILNK